MGHSGGLGSGSHGDGRRLPDRLRPDTGERAIADAGQGSEDDEDGQELLDAIRSRQLEEGLTARFTEACFEIGALPLESAIVLIAGLSDHLAEESSHEASEESTQGYRENFS